MAKNQTSWKKGESGNPDGPPLYWETHEELYKKYSTMPLKELRAIDLDEVPIKYAIIINDLIKARRGKDKSIDRFHNRTDGKAVERKDITSGGETLKGLVDVE